MNDLQAAAEAALGNGRIAAEQALRLADPQHLHELGEAGNRMRARMHGNKAFYVYNQHLNYTNICRNACKFCAFSKRRNQPGGYVMDRDDLAREIESRMDEDITELHIVGGLNPDLPYEYYLDMISLARKLRPQAWIKAFTAVEIAFLADERGVSVSEVLADFKNAGLDMLPGGGAEVFAPHLRKKICPEKIPGERWLKIHKTAHRMGIKTNCTMLFGHVESWDDRLHHLLALRDLQDETSGFVCFIPLPYQPENNPLSARGPDGIDFALMMSISRIFLDNIEHLKAYWAFSGIKSAQLALNIGADDFDGTLVKERIGHAAGADSPSGMTEAGLRECIEAAGFVPVRRDSIFGSLER